MSIGWLLYAASWWLLVVHGLWDLVVMSPVRRVLRAAGLLGPAPCHYSKYLQKQHPYMQHKRVGGLLTDVIHIPADATSASDEAQQRGKRHPKRQPPPHPSVVIFPGNPGAAGFYTQYARHLHERSGRTVEVYVVGHAGHSARSKLARPHHYEAQIDHKRAFVRSLLQEQPHRQLVLIGHSIGAFMALCLLGEFGANVVQVQLLCPTVQHIGASPQGRWMSPVLHYARLPLSLLGASLKHVLPHFVLKRLLRAHLRGEEHAVQTVYHDLLDFDVLRNALYMGSTEMRGLKEMPADVRKWAHSQQGKLVWCFAETDSWVPTHHHDDIREMFPGSQVHVKDVRHAFVIGNGEEMSQLSWEWIRRVDPGRGT